MLETGDRDWDVAAKFLHPTGVPLVLLLLWSSQDEQQLVTCPGLSLVGGHRLGTCTDS